MPHMLAEEHMGYVVIDPNLPRNQATWANALSTIGGSPACLVLTKSGDGAWAVGTPLVSPANVVTFIPPGVTVNVASGVTLTLNGPVFSANPAWQTGSGTVVRGTATPFEISALEATVLKLEAGTGQDALQFTNPTASPVPGISMGTGLSGADVVPFLTLTRTPGVNAGNWSIMNTLSNREWVVTRPAGLPRLALNDVGLWISQGSAYTSAAHLLHLQLDDAFKPNDGSWDFPSDERLKNVQRPVTEGLADIQNLPTPVWFRWNGKGGTDAFAAEQMGWIAQQTVDIAPYLFKTYEDKLEPTDTDRTTLYSGNYSPLLPLLANAVKELATRLEALEALAGTRVPALEDIAHTHTGTGTAAGVVAFVPQAGARAAGEQDESEEEERPRRARRRHR